jgi:hypothetical protein
VPHRGEVRALPSHPAALFVKCPGVQAPCALPNFIDLQHCVTVLPVLLTGALIQCQVVSLLFVLIPAFRHCAHCLIYACVAMQYRVIPTSSFPLLASYDACVGIIL